MGRRWWKTEEKHRDTAIWTLSIASRSSGCLNTHHSPQADMLIRVLSGLLYAGLMGFMSWRIVALLAAGAPFVGASLHANLGVLPSRVICALTVSAASNLAQLSIHRFMSTAINQFSQSKSYCMPAVVDRCGAGAVLTKFQLRDGPSVNSRNVKGAATAHTATAHSAHASFTRTMPWRAGR